jgi:hypothetical protein
MTRIIEEWMMIDDPDSTLAAFKLDANSLEVFQYTLYPGITDLE